jgi:tetratricopeptide (TPR) repeat protein
VKLIDSNEERLSVGENIKNLLASFTTLLSLPLPSERKYDYVYDFTYELDSTVSLSIPDKSNVIQVYKTGANYENDFFSLQHSSKKSSNYAEISSNFILKKKRIPVESYHDFYQQIEHAIKQADAILAYLKSSPSPPSKQRIQTGTDEFTNLLNKAEQALDQANYQKAKELALKGLELNNSDPKIYYILGVSSGFLDDYDSSENYLKKAEELGFQP